MKTEHLQYLLQLSQSRSISLAAEKCHISQQAFSAAIKQLEQELEVPLLIRSYQGVTLTPQGKDVLAYAKLVLYEYDLLKDKLKASAAPSDAIKGKLKVLAGPAASTTILYKFIPDFYQLFPQIALELQDMEISNIYAALSLMSPKDQANCIGLVHAPLEDVVNGVGKYHDTLDFVPLFEEKLVACISKYSDLAKHKKLSVRTLLKHPLVMYVTEELQTNIIYNMLLPYGTPNIHLISGNPYIFFQSIAQNMGIGVVPAGSLNNPTLYEALQDITLVQIKENLHTTYGCLLSKSTAPSPALAAFISALKTYDFR